MSRRFAFGHWVNVEANSFSVMSYARDTFIDAVKVTGRFYKISRRARSNTHFRRQRFS